MAVHVRYKSLYIPYPSSAKQQFRRKMTKFCVVWATRTTAAKFSYFCFELNAVITYLVSASFLQSHRRNRHIWTIAKFVGKIKFILARSHLQCRHRHCFSSLLVTRDQTTLFEREGEKRDEIQGEKEGVIVGYRNIFKKCYHLIAKKNKCFCCKLVFLLTHTLVRGRSVLYSIGFN